MPTLGAKNAPKMGHPDSRLNCPPACLRTPCTIKGVNPSRTTLLLAALSFAAVGIAQSPAPYDPLKTFAPLTLPEPVNSYRSSNGAPGPLYWQNRADYELHATIDTASKTLNGTEVITYTNHSPDTLTSLDRKSVV